MPRAENSTEFNSLPTEERRKIATHQNTIPVKIGEMAKSLGVKVLLSTLPRGTSGEIENDKGAFVIKINRHEAKHRKRFVLAHILSHYLLHRENIPDGIKWSENVLLRSGQDDNIDYEANRLAFDLLLPHQAIDKELSRLAVPLLSEAIEILARKFRVSKVVIGIRLDIMGIDHA